MVEQCVACEAPLGDGPKRAPVNADGEVFCPRCFVHHRAHQEPSRFAASRFAALLCSRCGWESADFGRGCCGQCGSRFVVALPPAVPS
jgi:hypothetical protein